MILLWFPNDRILTGGRPEIFVQLDAVEPQGALRHALILRMNRRQLQHLQS